MFIVVEIFRLRENVNHSDGYSKTELVTHHQAEVCFK